MGRVSKSKGNSRKTAAQARSARFQKRNEENNPIYCKLCSVEVNEPMNEIEAPYKVDIAQVTPVHSMYNVFIDI
jgi:hypothetical protein